MEETRDTQAVVRNSDCVNSKVNASMMLPAFDAGKLRMWQTSHSNTMQKVRSEFYADKSPKGTFDAPIIPLIDFINTHASRKYVTTSSCSGRIAIFVSTSSAQNDQADTESVEHIVVKSSKGKGRWALSSHGMVTADQFMDATRTIKSTELALFKVEPFVMHVQCSTPEAAQELLQVAQVAGFRESGIALGKKKIMVAIRTSSNKIEVPIFHGVDYDRKRTSRLVSYASERFVANARRTYRLCEELANAFESVQSRRCAFLSECASSLGNHRCICSSRSSQRRIIEVGYPQLS